MKKRKSFLALLLSASMVAGMNPNLLQITSAEEVVQVEEADCSGELGQEDETVILEEQTEAVKEAAEEEGTEAAKLEETEPEKTEPEEIEMVTDPVNSEILIEEEESAEVNASASAEILNTAQQAFVDAVNALNKEQLLALASAYKENPCDETAEAFYAKYDSADGADDSACALYEELSDTEQDVVADSYEKLMDIMDSVNKVLETEGAQTLAVGDPFEADGLKYQILTLPAGGNPGTARVTGFSSEQYEQLNIPPSVVYQEDNYSVTEIGDKAFSYCQDIKELTLPETLTSIGREAFYWCYGIKSIRIPDSVTSIGDYAFYSIYCLSSIDIPDSVTKIGSSAFSCNSNLNDWRASIVIRGGSLTLSDNYVKALETTQPSARTLKLTKDVTVSADTILDSGPTVLIDSGKTLTVNEGVTLTNRGTLNIQGKLNNNGTIYNAKGAKVVCGSVNFDTIAGNSAYYSGTGTITCEEHLFNDTNDTICNNCGKSFTVAQKKFMTDAYAIVWDELPNLAKAYAEKPSSANLTAYNNAMSEVYGVNSFYRNILEEDQKADVADVYHAFDAKKQEVEAIAGRPSASFVIDGITYIPSLLDGDTETYNVAVKGRDESCEESIQNVTGAITIPDTVKGADLTYKVAAIQKRAFEGCTNLTSVSLPNTLTDMGKDCFKMCTSLTTVTFGAPSQITCIQGFRECTALKDFIIPDSVTEIGPDAFADAQFDEDIVLPENLKKIGSGAFIGATRSDDSPLSIFVSSGALNTDQNPFSDNQRVYYPIHVVDTGHGTVSFSSDEDKTENVVTKDGTTYALSGADITMNAKPETGYYVTGYSAVNQNNEEVTLTDHTFTMGGNTGANGITVSVTFDEIKHVITPSTAEITMNANEGYSSMSRTVSICNEGNQSENLTVDNTKLQYFDAVLSSGETLAPGESDVLTVTPATGLQAGIYTETVTIKTDSGLSKDFEVTFTVNTKLVVTISDDVTIPKRSNVTLTAALSGGTKNYSYAWSGPLDETSMPDSELSESWWENPSMIAGTADTYQVAPLENTKYACHVSDGNESYNKVITVTVRDPYLVSIPVPAPIVVEANGTEKTAEALGLPKTVSIKTEDVNVTSAEVSWNVDEANYDPSVLKEQTFTINGTISVPDGIVQHGISTGVSIRVTVNGAPFVMKAAANVASGTYKENQIVTLTTATKDAVIYYTIDGTDPSAENGTRYVSPVSVTGVSGKEVTTTIKAIAVKAGMQDSEVVSFTYTIAKAAGGKEKTNVKTVLLKEKQSTTTVKVSGLAKGDKVTSYKSSNKKIFTVTSKGKITAKKKGSAVLTMTLKSGKKLTVKVKVQKTTVKTTKLMINKKTVNLKKGKSFKLTATVTPLTSQEKVTFKSSNSKVAAVNSKGKITAKKKGTAVITVRSGKKSVKCKVIVR